MTKEELAAQLNWCEYSEELKNVDIELIKKSNLVVVFWASDDLMEFEWAISDERGCFEWWEVFINKDWILRECCDNCPSYEKALDTAKCIEAIRAYHWCNWRYKTDIPHACFDVMEWEDKYCRGIVFSMDDV